MKSRIVSGDGSHSVQCDCGWESVGWHTQKAAKARRAEHAREHETGEPAPELANSEART